MSDQLLAPEKLEVKAEQESRQIIGLPLKRKEDPRIVAGLTHYVDDIKLPGMLFGAVLRSQYAHARIKKIETGAAQSSPGVALVMTSKDIPKYASSLPVLELKDGSKIPRPVLAVDEVCYYGEPVAFVIADTRYGAEDALEALEVEFEPLPPVIDPVMAINEDSPRTHEGIESNLVQVETIEGGDVDSAFERAAKIVKLDLLNQRLAPAPLEPRSIMAQFDRGSQTLTVWMSTQGPFQNRSDLSDVLQVPENRIRVFAPDVGGGFGAKLSLYPEDVLVCLAAMKLGRPVKWIENRSENFTSMTQGRGQNQHVELASNDKGRILGLRVRLVGDAGAYYTEGSSDATFTLKMCPGQYMIPAYKGEAFIALTNKVPHDAYRGASRPEATYLIERAMDELARELHLDPAEIRLRNFIPRENFPFKTVSDLEYDTGDYSSNLRRALELSNYERWKEERNRAIGSSRAIGIGLTTYVEICAFGPEFPETAALTVSQTGKVTIVSGTSPHGQGHESPLSQIVAQKLGISPDDVVVNYGDTFMLPWGTFTAGSRSAALGGSAVLMCAEKIKSKMAMIAAKALEVPEKDLVFRDGQIFSRYEPDNSSKKITFEKVAYYAYRPKNLPLGMEPVLYAFSAFAPPNYTYPFGTHLAVVELDKETGRLRILEYTSVDDCGRVINPLIVEGQIHGGITQGVGQALLEGIKYDETGTVLTASFMDYQIPLAEDVPNIHSFRTETPTYANPLGVKGIGEAGTIAATPALANAVRDALSQFGAKVEEMPLSLDYVWSLANHSCATS